MRLRMVSFLTLILFSLYSCTKRNGTELSSSVVPNEPVVETFKNIVLGSGSGDLVIDGNLLSLGCRDTIRIAGGSYNNISIKNIRATDGCNIIITNKGLVELNGAFRQMNLSNLRNVTITGNGDPNIKYGFLFRDNFYRAIVINKPYDKTTLEFLQLRNIGDYCISKLDDTEYTGTENSYSKDLKFLNMSCENTGNLIVLAGSPANGKVTGFVRGLEIANIDFRNSNSGSLAYCGNVENYNIHHNKVDDVNKNNNNHNGIFQIIGNGSFHNNYISNHQGNAIRAWICTVGAIPKNVLIYNNIVMNSRKYSAFEVQSFNVYMSNKVTYANAIIYNNTCGNMNTTKDWYGVVLDVYGLEGGYCKVFNNLAFSFPAPNPSSKFVNQQSVTIPEITNNLYFNTAAEAGFSDSTTYTLTTSSPAKNKGLPVRSLLLDFHGQSRSRMNPSIGAVE